MSKGSTVFVVIYNGGVLSVCQDYIQARIDRNMYVRAEYKGVEIKKMIVK